MASLEQVEQAILVLYGNVRVRNLFGLAHSAFQPCPAQGEANLNAFVETPVLSGSQLRLHLIAAPITRPSKKAMRGDWLYSGFNFNSYSPPDVLLNKGTCGDSYVVAVQTGCYLFAFRVQNFASI